ncbi:MAG: hypothetical protein JNK54_03060 [Elusimicrobia bacterium]|nr:hypothetical protein [Elusimicrobiota bacterium]
MRDFFRTYIEMQDMEFTVYVAAFMFGFILLIGLVGKLIKTKPDSVSTAKKAEKKDPIVPSVSIVEPSVQGPIDVSVPEVDGMMMWEGDDGKKKKKPKRIPVVQASPSSEKVMKKPVPVLPQEPITPIPPEEKTVVIPPQEGKGPDPVVLPVSAVPSPGPNSEEVSPLPPPPGPVPVASPPPVEEKSVVDFHMYETLVRRIAGLEAEVKREPLYLDPLLKRVGNSEKRLDELVTGGAPGAKAGPAVPAIEDEKGNTLETEVKELREKVGKLQKLLETLSEGPTAP